MNDNNTILSKLFTQYSLKDFIERSHNPVYDQILNDYQIESVGKTNQEIIGEIYRILSSTYRNEYFYQNSLVNKLLNRQTIRSSTALTQISIGKSKADFVLINGKAVVYEIKSDLDSFSRLEAQLTDYYKAFSHVAVVTSERFYSQIHSLLQDSPVGYYILTARNTISRKKKKEPQEFRSELQHKALFKLLTKGEYESLLLTYFKELPTCPPVFYYDKCFSMFRTIPIQRAYKCVLNELKKRNKIEYNSFNKIPYELKSLVYFANITEKERTELNIFLETTFGG